MIEIEFAEPQYTECECCGGKTTSLTRFVYKNGDPFSIYYLCFTDGHKKKIVDGIMGLGEWEEDTNPQNRVAFPFRITLEKEKYNICLVDSRESSWQDTEVLGKILDREESRKHYFLNDVFQIIDHIVIKDSEIIEYFN